MSCRFRFIALVAISALVLELTPVAHAVPYASGVRNTSGTEYEFVLNEPADSITILRDGANPVTIADPGTAGRKTFDLGGFSAFEIQVAKDTPEEWTKISDDSNLHGYFFRPTGLAVNQDPSSPYFGTIYISNPAERIPNGFTILDPRAQGEGIYSLTADQITVDLANNFAQQLDPDDVNHAKKPASWTTSGNDGSSPYKLSLDDGGNLIVGDFSDQNGGIKYAAPDLVTGGLVLAEQDGIVPLLTNGTGTEEIHGSIVSAVGTRGTVGVDLTVWAVDEDYDLDGDTFTDPDGAGPLPAQDSVYHVWRWDVGAATDYDQSPTVAVDKELLSGPNDNGTPADTSDDYNDTAFTLTTDEAGGFIFNNMRFNDQFNKAYITQDRFHGNESGLFIVTPNGDGETQTLEWSSKGFSAANGLDGALPTTDPEFTAADGLQDIFRAVADIAFSADGSTMYVYRSLQYGDGNADGENPVLGPDSNAPGFVLVVPLDENGIPDLIVDDNGTPGDTSDDFISNISSIPIDDSGRTHRVQIDTDAAGNVYTVDNLTERLNIWSPGGNTLAITGSDGTFSLSEVGAGLVGDYNGNGVVDAADYTIWRDTLGDTVASGTGADGNGNGVIDTGDYDTWKTNFGNTSGAGAGSSSVPEPATATLLTLLAGLGLARRRRA